MTPKFSIITCTFNAENTLDRTLRSVAEQDYGEIELIIIDGASSDTTLETAHRYDGLITHLVSEPDRGIYDAMNKGITISSGDYLCFLNAGDRFHNPDTLTKMVSVLKEGCLPDVIYGDTDLMDEAGNDLGPRRFKAPEVLNWKSFKNGMCVCHQAFFVSASMAKSHKYDLQYRYSSDQDWCIRIMKAARLMQNAHMVIIDYLNEGTTTRHRLPSLLERFRIMVRHYGLLSTLMHHVWFFFRFPFQRILSPASDQIRSH